MSILLDPPFHSPIGGRFQIINRYLVPFQIPNPLEMFNKRFQLVVPSNDGFGVDGSDGQVGEQDRFLA